MGIVGKRRLNGIKSFKGYSFKMKQTWWSISKTGFLLVSESAENLCVLDFQRLNASFEGEEQNAKFYSGSKMLLMALSLKCSDGYLSSCSKSTNNSSSASVSFTSSLFIFEFHSLKRRVINLFCLK